MKSNSQVVFSEFVKRMIVVVVVVMVESQSIDNTCCADSKNTTSSAWLYEPLSSIAQSQFRYLLNYKNRVNAEAPTFRLNHGSGIIHIVSKI